MAKWLRSEDTLQAFKEVPSNEETTTDKDEISECEQKK
jgi:hypothetical protein